MAPWWPTALERLIAVRYLRGQRGTRSASLQTRIAIGGFAVGVMALILVLGVMNGLSNDLRDKILIASPHLRVLTTDPGLRFDNWEQYVPVIKADPEVIGVAPEVSSETLVRNDAKYTKGVLVLGLESGEGAENVMTLDSALKQGDLKFQPTRPQMDAGIAIGDLLAGMMGVGLGDHLLIYPPTGLDDVQTGMMPPRRWEVEVTGIFSTGMVIYDQQTIVMSRTIAQEFTGLGTAVTDLAVQVRDPWRTPEVAARLEATLGLPFRTETWQQRNGAIFSALKLEKLAMGLVIFIIMVVAAFNIVGTLTMVVAFKTREIGILQAMGMKRDAIRRIFIIQGATVGLVGTTIGLVLGVSLSLLIDRSGLIPINPDIYFIDRLPIRLELVDVTIVVVASLAASIFATLHPSRQAGSLSPVEAIRAE